MICSSARELLDESGVKYDVLDHARACTAQEIAKGFLRAPRTHAHRRQNLSAIDPLKRSSKASSTARCACRARA